MNNLFKTKQGFCAICGTPVTTDERYDGEYLYCNVHWESYGSDELSANQKVKNDNKEFKKFERRLG